MKSWIIIGCGYVGKRLALELLKTEHNVVVTSRSVQGQARLSSALPKATARRYVLGEQPQSLSEYDVVVLSVPPGTDAPSPERAFATQLSPKQRLIYLSTTGVYAPAHGAQVHDESALAPTSERSARRLAVEKALCDVHANTLSLRIASIYGPGRGVHERMRRQDYRLIGNADTIVNRIYVDDLVSAILVLGQAARLDHKSYVIADELPTSARSHARGISERLDLPMPPTILAGNVSSTLRAMMAGDRVIVPRRLHALGWRARYPSWREGLEQALRTESQLPAMP